MSRIQTFGGLGALNMKKSFVVGGRVRVQYSSGSRIVIVIWNYLLARRLNGFTPPG